MCYKLPSLTWNSTPSSDVFAMTVSSSRTAIYFTGKKEQMAHHSSTKKTTNAAHNRPCIKLELPLTSSNSPGGPICSPFSKIFLIIPPSLQMSTTVIHETSSTSNSVKEFGGTQSLNAAPYPNSGGIVNNALSPFLIVPMAWSNPGTNSPNKCKTKKVIIINREENFLRQKRKINIWKHAHDKDIVRQNKQPKVHDMLHTFSRSFFPLVFHFSNPVQ